MKFSKSGLIVAAATLFCASWVNAQGPVVGSVEAFIVSIDGNGKEIIEKAKTAEPGEIMEYRLVFTNNGDSAVKGLKIVDPVPVHTSFIEKSNSTEVDAAFEVSIDGGKTFEKTPVVRIETQADGTQKKVVIPAEKYTHLRWNVEESLGSDGDSQVYAYRVVVN